MSCPLCRKILCPTGTLDIASVPTNTYVLCILKMTKTDRKPAEPVKNVSQPNWCLTCGTIGNGDCLTNHSTLDMSVTSTMSNFEALLAMKADYSRLKQPIRSQLEAAVKKEKDFLFYLNKILQALKSLETDILNLDADSRSRLSGLIFLKESRFFSTQSKEEENEAFLSELFSLGNSSQTLETLKKKMQDSFQEIKTKLNSSESDSELPELVNSTRIAVKLFPENSSTPLPCPSLLENGFTSKWERVKWNDDTDSKPNLSHTRRDQLLLSHLIFSIRKRHGIKTIIPDITPLLPSVLATLPIPKLISMIPAVTPSPVPLSIPRFVHDKCIFILTLKKSNTIVGKVHFRPTLYYPNFVQVLGDFCFGKVRPINSSIGKAVSEVYVNVPLSMTGFQPGPAPTSGPLMTKKPLDVGLVKLSEEAVPKWGLIFMLDKCIQPNFAKSLKAMKSSFFFGRIVEGQSALHDLSGASKTERSNYTFTLESRAA